MGLDGSWVIIFLVLVAFAAVRGRVRFVSAARQRESLRSWEENWLRPSPLVEGTGSESSQSARVEGDVVVLDDSGSGSGSGSVSAFSSGKSLSGTWTGSFSYNNILKSSVKVEDGKFTAEFSQEDKIIAGHIEDALGDASFIGVIEYPSVRFAKSYESSNSPSWRVGEQLGKVYYEGRVSADGESMTGEWFQFPFERSVYAGTWRMVYKGREVDESVLVPRKVEAADGSVLVPLKPKAADGAVLVPRKAEAAEPGPVAPETASPEAAGSEAIAPEATTPEPANREATAPGAAAPEAVVEPGARLSAAGPGDESIICPHCQAKTPGAFDFCLYCSQSLA